MPRNRSFVRKLSVAGLGAALVVGLSAFAPAPAPHPSDAWTGDPALADRLRTATAGLAGQGFAAATPEGSAAIGTADVDRALTARTPQEIGSVTKSLTGLLLADMVARGEVAPATTLGEVYPHLRGGAAAITLDQLATHTSGLPRLSTRAGAAGLLSLLTHGNPYRWDTPDNLLRDAAWTPLRTAPGTFAYSNLGYAVLGNALAERTGQPYPQLLAERVLTPLGLTRTVAAPAAPPAGAARQLAADGREATVWLSAGSTPAGTGVWSDAEDLGALARAAATGGLDPLALAPRIPALGGGSGWGWFTVEVDGRTLVGNNGATTGVQASVWAEPASGAWVAVTSPSGSATVDTQTIAFRLLGLPSAT
ncbi:serine hydrolase domain-containing protein [Kineococcus rhizosphaerae]|uniref:CubicO group peptidase (Beta-lactamase class C family) n=1 Tax=Kineococcus rhizosphaerae TaxID=559628 RepID=A0A2T0QZ07_9ACTN|nr:serine hydrolase domain-containing protein [Kineococcus rhizosphaerae]PRY11749.1 CubicO group peptidase (beta-lactamase class C family) [Kineococcus rhizosphaerae]